MQNSTLLFLKQIADNNSKEWMELNKSAYQSAKVDFEATVTEIIAGFDGIDNRLLSLSPKNCIFRLHRDVRFSKDKSPYKTNFGAAISIGGRKSEAAGYYFHLQPGGSFVGGGCWMPMPETLKNIRQEIDYNFNDFSKIMNNKNFIKTFGTIQGEKLSRPPKGYEADNDAIEFLKMKSFTVGCQVSDTIITSNNLVAHILSIFKTMKPFVDFLNFSVQD